VELRVFFVNLREIIYPATVIVFLFAGVSAMADTIYVSENTNIPRISQAIDKASDGDVIMVHPGFYSEGNIIINKKITLFGIDFPVVDGNDSNEVFTITADSVTVSGLQVQNCGVSYVKDMAGIRIDQQEGCLIENNRLINTFFGIYLKNASNCIVKK
jgi:nitrous oxidase accessory protein